MWKVETYIVVKTLARGRPCPRCHKPAFPSYLLQRRRHQPEQPIRRAVSPSVLLLRVVECGQKSRQGMIGRLSGYVVTKATEQVLLAEAPSAERECMFGEEIGTTR